MSSRTPRHNKFATKALVLAAFALVATLAAPLIPSSAPLGADAADAAPATPALPSAAQTTPAPIHASMVRVVPELFYPKGNPPTAADKPIVLRNGWIPEAWQGTCESLPPHIIGYVWHGCATYSVEVRESEPTLLGYDWSHHNFWTGPGSYPLKRNPYAGMWPVDPATESPRGASGAPWVSSCHHHRSAFINCYPEHSFSGHSWRGHADSTKQVLVRRNLSHHARPIPGLLYRTVTQAVCVAHCTTSPVQNPGDSQIVAFDGVGLDVVYSSPAHVGGRHRPESMNLVPSVRCTDPAPSGRCGMSADAKFALTVAQPDGAHSQYTYGEYFDGSFYLNIKTAEHQASSNFPKGSAWEEYKKIGPGLKAVRPGVKPDLEATVGYLRATPNGARASWVASASAIMTVHTWEWVACGLGNHTDGAGNRLCAHGGQLKLGARSVVLPAQITCNRREPSRVTASGAAACDFKVLTASVR